ncbi:hypothetical protein D3C75_582320 [compost metagenome]
MVDDPGQVRRPALQLNRNLPVGQHGRQLRLLVEPAVQLPSLGRVLWIEVKLGRQPLLEPVAEGLAKPCGHAAGTDVRRHGQQQRHQGQAQRRQLLAAIGNKPLAEHRATALRNETEQRAEHHRQGQRGTDQQRGHQHEATDQAVAEDQRQQRDHPGHGRHPTLASQPARMGLMPGLRISQRQQWQTRRPQQAVGPGQQRADQTQADTTEPPRQTKAQLPRHFGAIQATQAGGDIG